MRQAGHTEDQELISNEHTKQTGDFRVLIQGPLCPRYLDEPAVFAAHRPNFWIENR